MRVIINFKRFELFVIVTHVNIRSKYVVLFITEKVWVIVSILAFAFIIFDLFNPLYSSGYNYHDYHKTIFIFPIFGLYHK